MLSCSAGRGTSSSVYVPDRRARESGLLGLSGQSQISSPIGAYCMSLAEHREPYEPRGCAVQNGELNPCCRQEKLKEVLLGHQPYRMAKALWDYSMVEKHEASEH